MHFSFEQAFDRNIGWVTDWEQQALRGKRIAIAGMGGVGGFHLLTLARLGVGAFNIADLDEFELANFNRQIGANLETVGRPKVEVLAEMAKNINPEARIRQFAAGVNDDNVDDFLKDVDLFVDGFDFFVLGIRRKVFARCAELGIPAVTAAPVGMGVGFLAFLPGAMSFEEYFRFEGKPELQQYVHFLLGVAPSGVHSSYLVDPSRLDFGRHRAPSTVIGCQLCASVTAAAAVKLLLKRGEVKPAPYHHHYDSYRGKLVETILPRGNNGFLQRLKTKAAMRIFGALIRRPSPPERIYPSSVLENILDFARWAPSGDNAQPWRFTLVDDRTVVVKIRDDSAKNVYEYRDGEPTLLSAGMLLENMRIAAAMLGQNLQWQYDGKSENAHRVTVRISPASESLADDLCSYVPLRSVNRRPYRMQPLSQDQKQALSAALGSSVTLRWHETFGQRWTFARLSAKATDIRLRIPETFAIHRRIIDWRRAQSPDGIPASAVGLDRMTLRMMRWAMQRWSRTKLLNAIAGTTPAALQMDYLPGLSSAGYFSMRIPLAASETERSRTLLEAGQAIQRFWLTATKLGLAMQPCLATLAFAHYGETDGAFTSDTRARRASKKLAASLRHALGGATSDVVFMGRIGWPKAPVSRARSTRLPLSELMDSHA